MKPIKFILTLLFVALTIGCAGTSKPVQKVTKPVDQTAAELVKIREVKNEEGETRAIVSPAEQKQLKFIF